MFVTKFGTLTAGLSSLSGLSSTGTPPGRESKLSLVRLSPAMESPLCVDLCGLTAE